MFKIPYLRWLIAFVLFLAAVLNYIDRNVLGLLAPTIQKDLAISDQQYATVINFFLVAYTVAYLLSGRIVDKLGVRLSMALFIGWWSISNALTGIARSVGALCGFRFLLGLGEAGMWTAAPKAVSEWFPASERGVAVGIYCVGAAVGATIAPILVSVIGVQYGWRWVFALSPVLAGLWLVLWLWLYKRPADHPRITDKERDYLTANMEATVPGVVEEELSERARWSRVFREPSVWQLMFARLLTDPVWYFFLFWMPKYMFSARGVDQKGMWVMLIVFVAADAGFLLGGFFSGRLIKRGMIPPAARLWVMLASACLVPLMGFIPAMPTLTGVIVIAMVGAYAHSSWLGSVTSLVVDIAPKQILGTAFGVIAFGSALGGIFMNQAVGWLVSHRSYDDCFYLMFILHPIALLLLWGLRKHTGSKIPVAEKGSPVLAR